jgi:hypothetical protein
MSRSLFVLALMTFAVPSFAADNGIYIGGSVGRGNVQVDEGLDGLELDADGNGFKAILGIRPLDFLGFELNYVNFGKPEDTVGGFDVGSDATGVDGFVVGFLGLPFMDLFAKAGYIAWDANLELDGEELASEDGQDFAWGLGAQVRFGSAAIRAEYEKFDIDGFDDVNMISLGFTWTFL